MELVAGLMKHPAYKVLIEELEAMRERYFATLARGIATQTGPVDQREIDEKRGFWKGAIYALKVFPKQTSNDWDKYVEAVLKESDAVE